MRFETGLVIQAIKTDDQVKAVKTLKFFANAGLIPTFEKRVLALAQTDNGSGVPALEGSTPEMGEIYNSRDHGTVLASFVGYLTFDGQPFCNATFIDAEHFIVPDHCGLLDKSRDLGKMKIVVADFAMQQRDAQLVINYTPIALDINSVGEVLEGRISYGTVTSPNVKLKSPPTIRAPRRGEAIKVIYFSLTGIDRESLKIHEKQCLVTDV